MHNRLIVPGLCAAALVYACGPWLRSASEAGAAVAAPPAFAATVTQPRATPHGKPGPALSTLLDVAHDGDALALSLHVVNNTARTLELRFPDARTHDFTVVDAHGSTVWRWSAGRLFTQAMQTRTLASHDTLTLRERWAPRVPHGRYTVIATLATERAPVVRQLTLALP